MLTTYMCIVEISKHQLDPSTVHHGLDIYMFTPLNIDVRICRPTPNPFEALRMEQEATHGGGHRYGRNKKLVV